MVRTTKRVITTSLPQNDGGLSFRFCRLGVILILLPTIAVSCSAPLPSPTPDVKPASPEQSISARDQGNGAEAKTQLIQAEQLHQDALRLYEQGDHSAARPLAEQAVTFRERVLGPSSPVVASSLNTLGLILHQLAELGPAQALFERALRIREDSLGAEDPAVAESLTNLARVLYARGAFPKARPLLDHAILIREKKLGPTHPDVGVSLLHLSIVQSQLGDLSLSRTTMERALRLLEPVEKTRPLDLAMALNYYGNILRRLGDFAEARPPLERSLQLREQALGPSHPHVARTLARLGMLEASMGNPQGALPLLERALKINEQTLGPTHAEVAGSLNELGRVKRKFGDLIGARSAFERALTIQEQSVGPQHPFVAVTLNELGQVLAQIGEVEAALRLFQRALAVQEAALGRDHVFIGETLTNLGYLQAQQGDLQRAARSFARAVTLKEAALGGNHPDLAASLFDLARAKHASGDLKAARASYERARRILLAHSTANQGLDDAAFSKVWAGQLKGLYDYAGLLAALARGSLLDHGPPSAVADSFLVTEQARGWIVQAAVAKAMARRQAGTPEEVQLAGQVEELRRRRQALWISLNAVYGQSLEQRNTQELTGLQEMLRQVQTDLDHQIKLLESLFPRYAAMALPAPLDIATARTLLRPGEALVSYFLLDSHLLIWLVRPDQETSYRDVAVSRAKVMALVKKLRASLIPAGGARILPPVDVESAFELYRLLLEPLRPQLVGVKDLILVPDEVLLALPFGVLVTERGDEKFQRVLDLYRKGQGIVFEKIGNYPYASLPWLARSYSLTILPSASALKLLRQTPRDRETRGEPFIGFGDPVLQGSGRERGGVMIASQGTKADLQILRALNRLPGTREELLAIARVMGVDPATHLFLDERATESQVKRLNVSGRLGQARVLAFSTHGLLAGEISGLMQPALVLTIPEASSQEDDGLLTLEEVLQLKLPHTDWVILSACNTASGDGSGESLSGLARAFFFAGARALLVSYWSVDDQATQQLMTEVFRRYGHSDNLSQYPAEALRQGMVAMLEQAQKDPEKAYFAHPYAWASFLLVGEPKPEE